MARSWHILANQPLARRLPGREDGAVSFSPVTADPAREGQPGTTGPHWAWLVAAVTFVTLVGAAAFRSVPGVLMEPLNEEFGWSHGTIGFAVSINLMLFGLFSPFAAALMDRFGVRRVVSWPWCWSRQAAASPCS